MTVGYRRSRARAALRVITVAALVPVAALAAAPPAYASISSPGATSIAAAMTAPGTSTTGATLAAPSGTPDGISSSAMAEFPTQGSTFAILTTGDVNSADDAPPSTHPGTTTDLGGPNVRGDTDFDVSILKIDFTVPAPMNCVRFDFRFLTEEWPEAVNTDFNDAFIAELDTSDWTTSGSTISAPHNFAFDPSHQPISVNAAGNTSMSDGPSDTTYDGATPVLTAAHGVSPGSHALYLSIFDQGDHRFDSAVFLDNLVVEQASNMDTQCAQGAIPKNFELTLSPPTATRTVGSTHTVTATLNDLDPGPVANGKILFSVSGANTASGTSVTSSSGHATFTYTGTHAGSDAITACYDVDNSTTCDAGEPFATVAATWQAPGPTPAPTTTTPGAHLGLPRTGSPIGLIAGAGLLALAIGAVSLILLRRRRVRFTAE